jgi:transcriptional regulator with XRE-family HTH domain
MRVAGYLRFDFKHKKTPVSHPIIIMTTRKSPKSDVANERGDELIDEGKLEVGKRIKHLREEYDWTLDELSQATKHIDHLNVGVSKVSISRYENGDTYPGYREIKLIALALAKSVNYFFYGDRPDPYSGWTMSLDEYLRSIIKDVLIEEGLVEGVTIRDQEMQKMRAMQAVAGRGKRFKPDPDPAVRAEVERKRAAALEELLKNAVAAEQNGFKKNQEK